MTAANLLRKASAAGVPLNVVLIERDTAVGCGVAYGTTDPLHVLNVPAARMSAWADQPEHFLSWASARTPGVKPGDFLPRRDYGLYVRETLDSAADAAGENARLQIVHNEAQHISRDAAGAWTIHAHSGAPIRADAVVLALGHRPPGDPLASAWSGPRERFIDDPWLPHAFDAIRPNEPVLILGSSLTAVDVLLSLHAEGKGRTAPTWLVSRRAMLPNAHLGAPNPPADVAPLIASLLATPGTLTARRLLREVRARVDAISPNPGNDWRTVVDALRPHTAALWNAMTTSERRRFIDRVRPFWEVHRHRMAPHIARAIAELRSAGRFELFAGRVLSARAEGGSIVTQVRRRNQGESNPDLTLRPAWIVNCTGPTPSNQAESNPVIASLLEQGALSVDELRLGIDSEGPGRTIDAVGRPNPDLFVVGTLRKPATWESTAVPELRQQAAAAAEAALEYLARRPEIVIPTRASAGTPA